MIVEIDANDVPHLTKAQMVEVDRAMVEDLTIELIVMMENAGRNLAHLSRCRFLGGDPVGKRVVVLAGGGGNGGGAMVAARRLHNWGAMVRVVLSQRAKAMTATAGRQLDVLRRMRVPVTDFGAISDLDEPDLVLDGLIGYSLRGAPRGPVADLIRWANRQPAPILALDTPSGLDPTTGMALEPAIRAIATMTLALPKQGLRAPPARTYVGELYLADIGVPPDLYAEPALNIIVGPLFARGDVIRLR